MKQGKESAQDDGSEQKTERTEEGNAAQNREEYEQRMHLYSAIIKYRGKKIINKPDDEHRPEEEPERCRIIAGEEQIKDRRHSHDGSAEPRNGRGDGGESPPQCSVRHAEHEEAQARQKSLYDINEKLASQNVIDGLFETIQYLLIVFVIKGRKFHEPGQEMVAILQEEKE